MENDGFLGIRNISEYLYCPRLFYFLEVEGIPHSSVDVEEGRRLHKKVDEATVFSDIKKRPESLSVRESETGKPTKFRNDSSTVNAQKSEKILSLELSCPIERISGKLDSCEFYSGFAYPVEYRKGSPQKLVERVQNELQTKEIVKYVPWPSDETQLGLQMYLLEQNGYKVKRGSFFYFKIRKRVEIVYTPELKKKCLEIVQKFANVALDRAPNPFVKHTQKARTLVHSHVKRSNSVVSMSNI
jgi:CRISP-associated protein Cas1